MDDWNDWFWQTSHSVHNVEALAKWVSLTKEEITGIENTARKYRWRISPYYASLMDKEDPSCPIRLQSIPSSAEMYVLEGAGVDPVEDIKFRKTNRVIHKYPDRAVFLVTEHCPTYCRHCTRKFHTSDKKGTYFQERGLTSMEDDFQYVQEHKELRDILLTGGDPLSCPDPKIEFMLKKLRSFSHVDIIRIGTRCPVFLPQRITEDFCAMLEQYHPIWVSTHFNHPKELTEEALQACDRLLRHGIPVQNQTVLLKGVNDDVETMRRLMRGLIRARVKPYYLYHCDNVAGVSHFMTSVKAGQTIMEGLWGHISGYAVPRYIVTTSLGKIPLEKAPATETPEGYMLENYRKEKMLYREQAKIQTKLIFE